MASTRLNAPEEEVAIRSVGWRNLASLGTENKRTRTSITIVKRIIKTRRGRRDGWIMTQSPRASRALVERIRPKFECRENAAYPPDIAENTRAPYR